MANIIGLLTLFSAGQNTYGNKIGNRKSKIGSFYGKNK